MERDAGVSRVQPGKAKMLMERIMQECISSGEKMIKLYYKVRSTAEEDPEDEKARQLGQILVDQAMQEIKVGARELERVSKKGWKPRIDWAIRSVAKRGSKGIRKTRRRVKATLRLKVREPEERARQDATLEPDP